MFGGHVCRGLALALVVSVPACNSGRNAPSEKNNVSGSAAAVETTTYQGVGVVKSTNAKFPSVELDHQEIKGLMPAMTMEFYVKDKSLLDGLKTGDRVEFTIENGVGGLKITALKKL